MTEAVDWGKISDKSRNAEGDDESKQSASLPCIKEEEERVQVPKSTSGRTATSGQKCPEEADDGDDGGDDGGEAESAETETAAKWSSGL